jgi:nicotinamide-nucleotide amidase
VTSAADLLDILAARGQTLAVAESLTGGLLSAAIVDVPGASRVFRGGLIVYATDLKASLAGVPRDLLALRGPVDPEVAAALAYGARERCSADWALATTGVAGPGPEDGIAAGTVFVAVAGPSVSWPHDQAEIRKLALTGGRPEVRAGAVEAVLDLLATALAEG